MAATKPEEVDVLFERHLNAGELDAPAAVPLLVPVNAMDSDKVGAEVEAHIGEGFGTGRVAPVVLWGMLPVAERTASITKDTKPGELPVKHRHTAELQRGFIHAPKASRLAACEDGSGPHWRPRVGRVSEK